MSLESLIGQYIFSQQQPAAKKPEEGGQALAASRRAGE